MKKFVTPFCGVLTAFLLVFSILSLSSCVENEQPKINLEFKSDYSGVIAAIESAKLSMSEKLSLLEDAVKDQTTSLEAKLGLVEAAVKAGFADADAQQKLLRQALESLSGTFEEKLAAVEAALKSQTTSLEAKLGLVEAAVAAGFADAKSQQELLREAVESLGGTLEEKLAALDTAVKSQTSALETKLGLIEAAVNAGFADADAQQKLLREAVEALSGTVEEKLSALDTAVRSQTAALESKLGLIEAAVTKGFADQQTALDLLKTSVESLRAESSAADSTLATAVAEVSKTLDKISSSLSGDISAQLSAIFQAVTGRPDHSSALSAILAAVEKIWKEIDPFKGHEYVDLGLPSGLLWATCNVGATKPEDYGDYFAWGETKPKNSYSWENYTFRTEGNNWNDVKFSKYCPTNKQDFWAVGGSPDNTLRLESSDDAARASWGGSWRMPTKEEFEELLKNCDGVWTTQNGVNGRRFTSTKNGNSIFLPAAGSWYGTSIDEAGSFGYYWSSSLYTDYPSGAWRLNFYSGTSTGDDFRYSGLPVRPVSGGVPVTKVELDKAALELDFGDSGQLTATVFPADATNKSVTWKSSDDNVAEVSQDGTISGKEPGKATITVTTADGDFTDTCQVTVKSNFNGHEYVDLDLPSGLKWATMNVGATKPEEYGDYFAWGDTTTYYKTLTPSVDWKPGKAAGYDWSTYKYAKGDYNMLTKYCGDAAYGNNGFTDALTTLEKTDDAAGAKWGGSWRMPTEADFKELLDNCDRIWKTNGWEFTSKKNGNKIFLPAAGWWNGSSRIDAGSLGRYWSSSLGSSTPDLAWYLSFGSGNAIRGRTSRFCGQSVRPVID